MPTYEEVLKKMGEHPELYTEEDRGRMYRGKPEDMELSLEEKLRFLPYKKIEQKPSNFEYFQPPSRTLENPFIAPEQKLELLLPRNNEPATVDPIEYEQLKKLMENIG
jgi:hypothetical protein